jgi:hypothetical protein
MNKAGRRSVKYLPLDDAGELSCGLSEFVEALGHYASRYAVGGAGDGAADEIKERTVRHYQAMGVIDRPEKQGREARYTKRHLLQMLAALKARASTGISPKALAGGLSGLRDEVLMEMLKNGVKVSFDAVLELDPAGERVNLEAMDKLTRILGRDMKSAASARELAGRLGLRSQPEYSASLRNAASRMPSAFEEDMDGDAVVASRTSGEVWRRFSIVPGVELMVRGDVSRALTESMIEGIGRAASLSER